MLFLTQASETFVLALAAAISTDWSVGYVDMDSTGATAGSAQGNSASIGNITVVNAPATGAQRQLKSMTVVNVGATAQTVTLSKNDGNARALIRGITLLANESLDWVDSIGFRVLDANGIPKGSSSTTPTSNTVTALSTVSGAVAIDVSLGDYFTLALSANVTSITFSGLPGSGKGASKWIQIVQDTTPRTVAWPSSFKWAGGTTGAVSTASGAVDELAITTVDNGVTWKATLGKAFS